MDEENAKKVMSEVELVELYDSFTEFNDYCAFLCDAVSCLFADAMESEPDAHTVMGLKRHCSDLKARAETLETMLHAFYQQSYTSSPVAPIT